MAEFFAKRLALLHDRPILWQAVVSKDAVLGYVTGRGESEVILDPEYVTWEEVEIE